MDENISKIKQGSFSVLDNIKNRFKNLNFQINGFNVIIGVLLLVLGWELGHRDYLIQVKNLKPSISVTNQLDPNKKVNLDFSLFWDTWNLVNKDYMDKSALNPQKLYYGAIQGMVAAIGDPYTMFLPPSAQQAVKEQLGGQFDGVGMELGYNKDKHLVVIAPLKGTPAAKAGVKPGDLILKINNQNIGNMPLTEAVNLIRGPKGSTVALELLSNGQNTPHEVNIVRDTIVIKSVEYELKKTPSGKNIAYISISTFGDQTIKEWDEAVNQALADSPQGVIVDVRNNPGGYFDAAIYIASEFLSDGTVVEQEDGHGNIQKISVSRQGRMLKLPLVVLINGGSASASEIFSGAMQDRKRGILVGEQSFGKGTIQTTEDLPGGTGIHITIAKWLTPNGRWIHNIGLTPDVKVSVGNTPGVDPQLEKALELLN